ncbi:MAG TPA: ADP-ribosylglycohydrolase family protein, partial [Candidatus Paceibacterota bacterium]|nr:ADP-ribosylglycohydrolase family protein [Candidatus Paceibacterota bacterium]
MKTLDLFKKVIFAQAIGDAIGVPFEFTHSSAIKPEKVMQMIGYGTWNQPPGTWSDDTAMTLATIASIENFKSPLPITGMMNNFLSWWKNGKFSCHGNCFDVGSQTAQALVEWSISKKTIVGKGSELGNGALMRIMPVAFMGYK